jgi:hypothetical protein
MLLCWYQKIRIMHCIVGSLVCPQLLPFSVFAAYILGILFNVLLIVYYDRIMIPLLVMCTFAEMGCVGLILELGSSGATMHIVSGQVVSRWIHHARVLGNVELVARVRACAPVEINVGSFFVQRKSTRYNLVLFLLLNSLKAIMAFSKQK